MPLRVGIIGLSASAITSWAADAHLPGLLTPEGRERFTIAALCNSSTEAAKEAIRAYQLPTTVKAYGDPQELANDPDVDFVICNTRVDRHLATILPSIQANKHVYIEWPIAASSAEIQQLVDASKASSGKTLVGLQGRWAPPVTKMAEIIDSGVIGKVLSSSVTAFGGSRDREILPIGLKYFAQRHVGGNPITIGVGHVIDYVQSVLGNLVPGSVNARFQLQRPNIRIRDPETNEIVEETTANVPDLLILNGDLPESSRVQRSATLSFSFRRGQPFPSTPSFVWTINGSLGEIRLVAPAGISLQADAYATPVTIQIHDFGTDTLRDVVWDWTDLQKTVPIRARSVQKVLYSFADSLKAPGGESDGGAWVEIEDAASRAEQIESWLTSCGF